MGALKKLNFLQIEAPRWRAAVVMVSCITDLLLSEPAGQTFVPVTGEPNKDYKYTRDTY